MIQNPLAQMPAWIQDAAARFGPLGERTGHVIEERVLAQIDKALAARDAAKGRDDPSPPPIRRPKPPSSVADEIAKLQALRDTGALTEEQYARAVDRAIGGG